MSVNRINSLFPAGYPFDPSGIAGLPVLGRDQFDPHVAILLVRLGDLWRDAAARLRAAQAYDMPDSIRPTMETRWRNEIVGIERLAFREVLIERGLMFNDEEEPPDDFASIFIEYAPGRSVYVAPHFAVTFQPDEPCLLPNA